MQVSAAGYLRSHLPVGATRFGGKHSSGQFNVPRDVSGQQRDRNIPGETLIEPSFASKLWMRFNAPNIALLVWPMEAGASKLAASDFTIYGADKPLQTIIRQQQTLQIVTRV